MRLARVRLLRHILPCFLLILREKKQKTTVLQSTIRTVHAELFHPGLDSQKSDFMVQFRKANFVKTKV